MRPFIGWGNGALLFVTFAVVGMGFNVALDTVMRRFVTPEVRGYAGRTEAVTVQVLATIYAVLVAYSQTLEGLDGVAETKARAAR